MAILNRGKMNLIVGIGNGFENQIFVENVHELIMKRFVQATWQTLNLKHVN
jgi:hypothetical protein